MGKAPSRCSPAACCRRIDYLTKKRKRDEMKPPYRCPICDTIDAIKLVSCSKHPDPDKTKHGHGTTIFTFACRKGCFNKKVELGSLNYSAVDGFNAVVDEIRRR